LKIKKGLRYFHSYFESPLGKLPLIVSDKALYALLWENEKPNRVPFPAIVEEGENEILTRIKQQLEQYFEGKRKTFEIPLRPKGTEFQCLVWKELEKIPFGQLRTYGQLAKILHQPGASRAVGAANCRNPISILVPCHRVVGSHGSLTGFAGGIKAKEFLLSLEGHSRLVF
jgi:methylated-DNA-[protein]-cysteine S-methyltransferase